MLRGVAGSSVDTQRTVLGIGTVAVLTVILSIHFLPDRLSLAVGERSPIEVRATRSVGYIDTDATERRRADAARDVPNSYDSDRAALAQATRYISDTFDTIRRVRSMPPPTNAAKRFEALNAELGSVFGQAQIHLILALPASALLRIESTTRGQVETQMAQGIRNDTDDLARSVEQYETSVRQQLSSASEARIASAIGARAIRANQILNLHRTRQLRDVRRRDVPPVRGDVRAGEIVIRQGEIFTQLHADKAMALGLISPRIDLVTAVSILALSAAMVALIGFYLRRTSPHIYNSPSLLFLLCIVILTAVFGLKLFGPMLGLPLSIAQFGFLGMMMVVAAGMVIAVLLNVPLAILVTGLLSAQSGLIMNHELRFSVMTLISGLVGIYSVSELRDRRHLVRTTAVLAATNVALVWILGGLLGDSIPEVVSGSAWAVVAAFIGVGLFWFLVTVLEKPFGILTHAWLLELSASEHPLLRQLCVGAPGTYAHSIMVGNLAEAGAEAIGANALFCRVASYYHDVGKLKRPQFFVENQHAENVHNKLTPSMSALIIASHVRDGLEFADQHRLPPQLRDVIAQHHGTSLIQYFYNQAVAGGMGGASRHDPVLEEHFRYEGPKPQSREAGIIMLADTVEAAIRCLDKPTPGRIQSRIDELVQAKLVDGQLDECDMTFRDIGRIESAFTRILSAMLHGRIEYDIPKPPPGLAAQGLKVEVQVSTADIREPVSLVNADLYTELTAPQAADEAVARSRTRSPSN